MILHETAYAKINLALHVRARRPDGYHDIETLFAFCEDGDLLQAEPADRLTLTVQGPFAADLGAGEDNLVLRAARALADTYAIAAGATLHLDKRLPVASGIGGGSADAAAALRLLVRLWSIDASEESLLAIARTLGADVPACLRSHPVRGGGRGDALLSIDVGPSPRHVLLVNPRVPLSTAAVFNAWDGMDRGALPDDPVDARNDLETAAIAIRPRIADVLDVLRRTDDPRLVRMSGSGATCFALFDDEQACANADARIATHAPHWWRLRSRLRLGSPAPDS